jgi:hypothetical protein
MKRRPAGGTVGEEGGWGRSYIMTFPRFALRHGQTVQREFAATLALLRFATLYLSSVLLANGGAGSSLALPHLANRDAFLPG